MPWVLVIIMRLFHNKFLDRLDDHVDNLFNKLMIYLRKLITNLPPDSEEDLFNKKFIEETLPTLKFGDIIWAQRYNNDIEKDEMGDGHITGPFIYVGRDGDKAICLYCTSSTKGKNIFQIGEDDNPGWKKDTYVNMKKMKTIDGYAFMCESQFELSEFDVNKIKKKLALCEKFQYDDFGLTKDYNEQINIDYDINDVVLCGGRYYVIVGKDDKGYFNMISINNYDKRYSYLDFSEATVDYSNIKKAKAKSLYYINTIANDHMAIIMSNYIDYINKKMKLDNKSEKLFTGCVVKANKKTQYVYGMEGEYYNTFVIKPLCTQDGVVIMGKHYEPLYEELNKINYNHDQYRLLGVASDQEIDEVKKHKKDYKKKAKNNMNKVQKSEKVYQPAEKVDRCGKVLCLREDITKKYIVCDESKDCFSVISVNDLLLKKRIKVSEKPKKLFRDDRGLTSIELELIKRTLIQLDHEELSLKVR